MQEDPMNFNWAQYGGIWVRAILDLPQCSIYSNPWFNLLADIDFIAFTGGCR
jgi:hypothetical protein